MSVEQHQQTSVEQHQQTSVEQHQHTSVEQHQHTSVEQHQQTSVEQHRQTSVEQLQQTSVEQHHETSEPSSDSEFNSPEFNRTLLNQVAQSMDCTPAKYNVSRRGQVKTKLAHTFDFSVGKFDSPEEEEEIKDSCFKDLDWLMVLLGGGGGGGGGRGGGELRLQQGRRRSNW